MHPDIYSFFPGISKNILVRFMHVTMGNHCSDTCIKYLFWILFRWIDLTKKQQEVKWVWKWWNSSRIKSCCPWSVSASFRACGLNSFMDFTALTVHPSFIFTYSFVRYLSTAGDATGEHIKTKLVLGIHVFEPKYFGIRTTNVYTQQFVTGWSKVLLLIYSLLLLSLFFGFLHVLVF